jgi:hypothetical protein
LAGWRAIGVLWGSIRQILAYSVFARSEATRQSAVVVLEKDEKQIAAQKKLPMTDSLAYSNDCGGS